LIYDIDNKETFDNIVVWLLTIRENGVIDFPIVLVANKTDLRTENSITTEMGQILADKFDLTFIETSVKENKNIDKTINMICRLVVEKRNALQDEESTLVPQSSISLNKKQNVSTNCC